MITQNGKVRGCAPVINLVIESMLKVIYEGLYSGRS